MMVPEEPDLQNTGVQSYRTAHAVSDARNAFGLNLLLYLWFMIPSQLPFSMSRYIFAPASVALTNSRLKRLRSLVKHAAASSSDIFLSMTHLADIVAEVS